MAVGICKAVYPCTREGEVATPPLAPTADDAVSLSFQIDGTVTSPPQDQLELKRDIERTLDALTRLYLKDGQKAKFRPYYVQLAALAVLGLAGPNASPEIARKALDSLTGQLIDDEGARIKNGHIRRLGALAALFSVPCLVAYVILRAIDPAGHVGDFLLSLGVDATALSSFMLLWVGCFLGVVLSYGVRTTTMTLSDLVNVDADRLLPGIRLLFAGAFTAVLGILLVLGVVEIKVGSLSSHDLVHSPMVAFLIGTLCGVSELTLPGAVAKKASDLISLK
jgi:hypothetical protein